MSQPRITIIGAGRMGQGLGLALKRRGYRVLLVNRTPRDVMAPLILHQGSWTEATLGAELILIATPDDAIDQVATDLAAEGAVSRDQVVLHLSGLLDRGALSALDGTGA
ncbi:MAG TPA: NAD(P)-binding domain-containing protein, partial [Gemmatimonadales bacterium]|nr:NAD(P)-binding domain-containing protein [Gemmatimonadales bacterium]